MPNIRCGTRRCGAYGCCCLPPEQPSFVVASVAAWTRRTALPSMYRKSVGSYLHDSVPHCSAAPVLLRAHVPLPLGSLLLRHLASFEESWQVVRSPCCPRELPDVISESLSLDAGSHAPAVHHVLSPVSSMMSSAFPTRGWVGFPRMSTNNDFSWEVLEVADIPLCSGLQVCSPPSGRPRGDRTRPTVPLGRCPTS
jgi:hypothetical protein